MLKEDKHDLLTPKEASEMLGVHPTTLRLWARQGKLPAYRTPGGHRRFDRQDILRLLEEGKRAENDDTIRFATERALIFTRGEVTGQIIPREPWYTSLSNGEKDRHRRLGRTMLGLLIQFVARENSHERILAEGRHIAIEMALYNRQLGLSLPQAVQAFMVFRDSLIDSLVPALAAPGHVDGDDLAIYRKARFFLNEMLCAQLQVYDAGDIDVADMEDFSPA